MHIPFSQPVVLDNTLRVLEQVLQQGKLSGVGAFTSKCEDLLQKLTGSVNLLTTSATHSTEMMGLLLDLKYGDEVILPSYTFVSTANAFALRGARIRFADNDEFGNIKLSEIERLINPKTKAAVVMHYAGNSVDMDHAVKLCKDAKVTLLEDAAQAIGSTYKGKALGTFGALGCFSFHDTKNVCAGEGGSLIINDSQMIERSEIIREKGTNRKRFFQGLTDKYTWVDIGSSYALSELNAAYLLPQLEKLTGINQRRRQFWKRYEQELRKPLTLKGIQILETPSYNDNPNAHMFAILLPKSDMRALFISFMKEKQVTCPFHYVALHTAPYGLKVSGLNQPESLLECERFSSSLVRLPLFHNMTDEQQGRVIDGVKEWCRQ